MPKVVKAETKQEKRNDYEAYYSPLYIVCVIAEEERVAHHAAHFYPVRMQLNVTV